VARPLREQFALWALVLMVPIGAIMTFAFVAAYRVQVNRVELEASAWAQTIAAHIDASGAEPDKRLVPFLEDLALPPGSRVMTFVDRAAPLLHHEVPSTDELDAAASGTAQTKTRPLTVVVNLPMTLAADRAQENYNLTLGISGFATLVLLIMQAVFLRRWLPALASLERSAEQVGAGDLRQPKRARMPSRELEHLQDAFREMVANLRGAREAIDRQMEEERRIRLEVESLQQQVIRQERLAAIGVLVSGIAHELNNPLQTISGFSELLQHDARMDDRTRRDLALIHQESARASAIIRNLSRFGRQQESRPAPVHLADVVASIIELRQRRLAEQGIRVERDERATRPARAVFTELQQVVLNFVINAEQAMRACPPAERQIVLRTFDDDSRVHLEVEDSGPGVAPEDETKLFQPFFTTKPVGEGTGLGLSVSYGIIHSLGGEIGYRPGVSGGALFHFALPVASEIES
jgi:signal transduction histidine kinase